MLQTIITTLISGLVVPIVLELWKEYRRKEKPIEKKLQKDIVVIQTQQTDIKSFLFLIKVFYQFLTISLGAFIVAFALSGFFVLNIFFTGGVSGICLLIHEITHINISLLIIVINIPFIILGAFKIGLKFALKTSVGILMVVVFLNFIPYPLMTSDKLLIAIFGGFFLGLGFGICIRNGCGLDGIDIIPMSNWKYVNLIGSIINVLIFFLASYIFGVETSLYSILAYYIADRTTDSFLIGFLKVNNRRLKWLKS